MDFPKVDNQHENKQVDELIDIVGCLAGFWLFIFNKKFRATIIRNFKKGNVFRKTLIIFEAISTIFVSVILPAILIYYVFME